MPSSKSSCRPTPGLAVLLILACAAAAPARADLAWHPDLPTALSASATSGKPVLVIFHAAWADSTAAAADPVLANSEVEAVVAACFEPVRLDVDAHADEARELGIDHVPAACVLSAERTRLTTFECPDTPAAFVAAAARAAQVAATTTQRSPAADRSGQALSREAFGDAAMRPSDAASAAVSSKVRQLSSFAEGGAAAGGDAARYADSAGSSFAPAAASSTASDYHSPPSMPQLPRTPPGWPAEQAASSPMSFEPDAVPPATATAAAPLTAAADQAAATPAPAAEPQPAAATPWLAASPPAAAPSATVTDVPTAAPAESTPEPPKTNAFLAALQKPWSIFSKSSPKPASEPPAPPPTMPPALPKLAASLTGTPPAAEADTLGPMPLGMEGYCPVTVIERGSWVEGRPQWGARHRGRTYLFAGPEQQRAFLADPDRYAPALSGDDPVLAFDGGRSEPGRRAFGVTYQARMYLFSSPDTRAAFTADPDRYTTRVMIAEGSAPADGIRRF